MKYLKMSLELLQTLNPLNQYHLFIKDQQPFRKDQLLYPDLYVLTNDEHWTVTPETHKYAAAAGPFCFVTTANGEQQDICNFDYYAKCTVITVRQGSNRQFQQHTS